jgi:hypothetical protein
MEGFMNIAKYKAILSLIFFIICSFIIIIILSYGPENGLSLLLSSILLIVIFIIIYFLILRGIDDLHDTAIQTCNLFKIGFTYIYIIFGFGILYYQAYNSNPLSFAYSGDLSKQIEINKYISKSYDKLFDIHKKIFMLSELTDNSNIAFSSINRKSKDYNELVSMDSLKFNILFVNVGKIQMKLYNVVVAHDSINHNSTFLILKNTDYELEYNDILQTREDYITNLFYSINETDFQNNVIKLMDAYKNEIGPIENDLNKYLAGHKIWTYLDFVYFSCITITTIGYGDIIPNSLFIRLMVIFESIIGVLFICFAITLFFNKQVE